MKNRSMMVVGVVAMALALLSACDAGSATPMERCESWCERRNMDPDCGAMFNCAATCTSILLSAGDRCEAEVDTLLTCLEGEDDLCPTDGSVACSAENTAVTMCSTSSGGDAGP